ncbi:hypothetical protein CBR_g41716 [Chara braunii]|uniref:Integrase zinc-binding domain-containing protein n=1 Tax=Chara braunii TaxID=69332 RepID=A0A388LWF4_CHABU|nr:hypothetical protein CBR_g41716 [Chara braunii]|eukprot:GBG86654.1 hypothetical protein CBR_g41716 [Chara braunii]
MDGNIYDQFGEAIDRRLGGVRAEAQRRAAAGPPFPAMFRLWQEKKGPSVGIEEFRLWQEKEEPPIGVEEVGSDEEVTQGPGGGSKGEEPIIIESDDENEKERMEPSFVLLGKMEDMLDKMGRYQQKLVGLCEEWMMELALAISHSLVEDMRTIEEGSDQVEWHEDLMGGMYLFVNTLLEESLDQSGSLNPAGNVDEMPESQDDELEEREIKEIFRAEEYDGIYLELGLLLSCEMQLRDASDRTQRMLHRYLVQDGHLFVRREVGNPRRVVCGRNRQIDVVAALHDGIAGGHRGVQATYAKISELYYWDEMMDMVGKFCRSCVPCQERSRSRQGEPLHPRLEREVGAVVHLDLLFMPLGDQGYNYIFDAHDNLSGFVDGRAIRTKTGLVLVSCIEEYYLRYPFVREFVMDRGSEFTYQGCKNCYQGKKMKEASHGVRLEAMEMEIQELRALVASQATIIESLRQQTQGKVDKPESSRQGEQRQPRHGLPGQPSAADPRQEPPMGRVILEPEEARAQRQAEREAFEFRAPIKLATLPVAAAGPIVPLAVEEGLPPSRSESAQGSAEGSMGVLLEAVHTMQEEVSLFSPEQRIEEPLEREMGIEAEGVIEGGLQRLGTPEYGPEEIEEQPMTVPGDTVERRPQRLDTLEYVPATGDLRSRLGSWTTGSGSGDRFLEWSSKRSLVPQVLDQSSRGLSVPW